MGFLHYLFNWRQSNRSSSLPKAVFFGQSNEESCNESIFRGYFDGMSYVDGILTISGWMLSLQGPYESCVLTIDGNSAGTYACVERPDVAQGLPDIPNALYSGFRFQVNLPKTGENSLRRLCVHGLMNGVVKDQMETGFVEDLYTRMPTPPPHFIQRVDEFTHPEFYQLKGIQNYVELLHLIEEYIHPPIHTMLDWGCGSGRLSGFFIHFSKIDEVHGCDIDAEATAWAQENYPTASFKAISPYPPTPYPSNYFDFMISFSVFTHLDKETQMKWIAEMRRILKPGGVFICTVHGLTAARAILNLEQIQRLATESFFDYGEDRRLRGIAPDEYYRAVFMTKEYVKKAWSPYFEILEQREKGASHYHDYVILKKKA